MVHTAGFIIIFPFDQLEARKVTHVYQLNVGKNMLVKIYG